jgi:uncharacterized membrane protein YhaH (DUF805 family)
MHERESKNDMSLKLDDLWKWTGEITRAPFAIWAVILFALKYNLDRVVLQVLFGRQWSVFSYFDQPFPGIQYLSPAQTPRELAALLLASLPFLWAGVILCIKRLRSAQFPSWLAVLFVVPILKWFLFVALALVPERAEDLNKPEPRASWFPKSILGSAMLAVGIAVVFAIVATVISAYVLRDYGWGLFVGVPFCMGFFSALIHGARERRSLGESLVVALASVVIAGGAFLIFAFEGVICLVMAAPLALVLALLGGLAGHAIQATRRASVPPQVYGIPLLAVPLMLGTETGESGPPPLLETITAIEVKAPVETVWKHVIEFAELQPPKEMLFKLGIAYPIRAEIQGHGPGAVRNCIFSTGPFVEPIAVWDEPRLLKFSVSRNPAPLDEWTPYHEIHPPHLKGFLVSEQGQFRLIPLPGGYTRLEGTTWYHHTMWPVGYWQVWTDYIIHSIHRRVLRHIKELAEQEPK